MNTFSSIGSMLAINGTNPNSISYINNQAAAITTDFSGLSFTDLSTTSSYATTSSGLNATDNTTFARIKYNNNYIKTSDFNTSGTFTIYVKHAARYSTLPPLNFQYPNVLTTSSLYTSIGSSFTVTFYSSLISGTSVPYVISGCTSANLSGVSLTGNFVAPYQTITYSVASGIGKTIAYNISGGAVLYIPIPNMVYTVSYTAGSSVIKNSSANIVAQPLNINYETLYLFDQSDTTNTGTTLELVDLNNVGGIQTTRGTAGTNNAYKTFDTTSWTRAGINITIDFSGGTAGNILYNTANYSPSAVGINHYNENSTVAIMKYNGNVLKTSDFFTAATTTGFSMYTKHQSRYSTLPPFNFMYPSVITCSSSSLSLNQSFTVTCYSSLSRGTIIQYWITGCYAADLSNAAVGVASLTGYFTAPSSSVTYNVIGAPGKTIKFSTISGLPLSLPIASYFTIQQPAIFNYPSMLVLSPNSVTRGNTFILNLFSYLATNTDVSYSITGLASNDLSSNGVNLSFTTISRSFNPPNQSILYQVNSAAVYKNVTFNILNSSSAIIYTQQLRISQNRYIVTVVNNLFVLKTEAGVIVPTSTRFDLSSNGNTEIVFDQNDPSNTGFPLTLSLTLNAYAGYYTTGVTTYGTPGLNGYTLAQYTTSATSFYVYMPRTFNTIMSDVSNAPMFWYSASAGVTNNASSIVTSWANQITSGSIAFSNAIVGSPKLLLSNTQMDSYSPIFTSPMIQLSPDLKPTTFYGFNISGGNYKALLQPTKDQTMFIFGYLHGDIHINTAIVAKPGTYTNGTLHVGFGLQGGTSNNALHIINGAGSYTSPNVLPNTNAMGTVPVSTIKGSYYMISYRQYGTNLTCRAYPNLDLSGQEKTTFSAILADTFNNFQIGYWDQDINRSPFGTIGEVVYFNSKLPTSEQYVIEGKMAWKYGVAGVGGILPSSHPYYSVSPT